jgi:hypothetical protein
LNDGSGKGGCGCRDSFDVYAKFEHAGDTRAAVKAAAELLEVSGSRADRIQGLDAPITVKEPWPDPMPLPAGLPEVEPFDFDLLPGMARDWLADIAHRMQCPPDFCAATFTIVAGSLIGRRVAIRPKRHDDWQVVPNLYGAMIGRPSLMKSPAMKEVLKPLARFEIEAKQEHAEVLVAHQVGALLAETTKQVQKGASHRRENGSRHGCATDAPAVYGERHDGRKAGRPPGGESQWLVGLCRRTDRATAVDGSGRSRGRPRLLSDRVVRRFTLHL